MTWSKRDEERLIAALNGETKTSRWWIVFLWCTAAVLIWDLAIIVRWP